MSGMPVNDETEAIAIEVLSTARAALMVSYRFLDRALWKMPFERDDVIDLLGCDGRKICFNADRLLKRYATEPTEVTRDLLHLVCHCIFYHPFVGNDVNPIAWDLACDIVTEAACLELAGKRFPSKLDARRRKVVDAFSDLLGNLSAEKLYDHILRTGMKPKEADYFKALFIRDDHGLWYHDKNPVPSEDSAETSTGDDGGADRQHREDGAGEGRDPEQPHDARGANDPQGRRVAPGGELDGDDDEADEGDEGEDPGAEAAPQQQQASDIEAQAGEDPDGGAEQEWQSISKQAKIDLETQAQLYGTRAGGMVQALRVANRRKADYRSFLRRFAQLDEELAVNDDEFDLVYYSYGLDVYGNMPLIEPLEYHEAKKVRDFVIAIDTSGSVEGALVRRFVEETYSVLKSTESFFTDVNVRIMQCDAHVQSDVLVRSMEEFEHYMEHFELKGFGGTDFRPVFARVDERIEAGDFENLKGLVYFTDGYGAYPERPPGYETVFVFADEGYSAADVPAWAMRLYLDARQLEGKST